MKKILAFILALAMCVSLCACGRRDIASPGSANEETADDANNNEENSNAISNGDNAVSSNGEANTNNAADNVSGESNTPDNGNNTSGTAAEIPESTEEYSMDLGSTSIDISYAADMTVSKVAESSVAVQYGENRLYVQDITSEFNPDKDEAANFLYDYAYNKCVDLVVNTFGQITQFTGEYNLSCEGNVIYGYAANMTCSSQLEVYSFIKLVTLDDGEGYAVMIGVCHQSEASIFDNIEVR